MFWFLFTLFCVAIWICFKKLEKWKNSYWPSRNVPFFNRSQLISNWDFFRMKHKIHETESIIYNAVKKEGMDKYVGMIELGTPAFHIMDPELIKTFLVKDFDSFVDRRVFNFGKKEPLFSKMLTMTKGQVWKDLSDSSDKLTEFLNQKIQNGAIELDLRDALDRFTMDVIASAAFGLDCHSFSPTQSEFSQFTTRFHNQFAGIRAIKFIGIFLFPKLFPKLGISVTDQVASNYFAQVIKKTIKHRETTGERRDDVLQLLIEARNVDIPDPVTSPRDHESSNGTFEKHATKTQLTEEYICAQCLAFFIGGFDTFETLLVMAAYELALNPEVQEKLHGELQEATEANNGKLDYDQIMKLEYLDQVISETLRKYPPVIRTERMCTKKYQIPNTEVTLDVDTLVIAPIYALHMDEQYFPNPNKFDPERFTAENKRNRKPYTYIPFGAGPRNCIATRFALAEGKAAIGNLILNFKLSPSGKTEIPMKFKPLVTFKPANGLWLQVTPRN